MTQAAKPHHHSIYRDYSSPLETQLLVIVYFPALKVPEEFFKNS